MKSLIFFHFFYIGTFWFESEKSLIENITSDANDKKCKAAATVTKAAAAAKELAVAKAEILIIFINATL